MRTRELRRLLAEAAKLPTAQKHVLMQALQAAGDAAQVSVCRDTGRNPT